MNRTLDLVVAACLAATSCGTLKGVAWPTTVRCLAMPSEALVTTITSLVLADGVAAAFSDATVTALEDVARVYGPDAVACVLRQLIDSAYASKSMRAADGVKLAAAQRSQDFLNSHEMDVVTP